MRCFTSPAIVAGAVLGAVFATSGCGASALSATGDGAASAHDFVTSHRAELEQEIARGSGTQLYELSKIVHCQNLPDLDRALHEHYAEIFPTPSPSDAEVAERVVRLMSDRKELRCRDLELGGERAFSAGRQRVFGESHNWHSRIGELSVLQRTVPADR
jgi:hypothetical protein